VFPPDVLREVFPTDVREHLYGVASESKEVLERLEILAAAGPEPTDPWQRNRLRYFRKKKAAWEAYLIGAYAAGLFSCYPR